LTYYTVDYSTDEQQHWQRMRDGLRELQPKFEAAGQFELLEGLSAEVEIFAPLADRQEMSRYL
jgi:hypothetical protein